MSGLGRYIVDAVVLEHRSPAQLARDHKISKRWIFKLLSRFREGGYAALEPCSRRPKSCSHQVEAKVQELIVKLRRELTAGGHDAGPEPIAYHLKGEVDNVPSVATVWRILKRNGLINPQPHKRPKSSFIRFEAKLPNETWQLDATPWQLADASPVEILNFIDDRSRVALASTAVVTVKTADPVRALYSASNTFGLPASLLSDNAAVFTGRTRRGKVLLELELERLGIVFKHSTPYHLRPAARSSASTKPSSASCASSLQQAPCPSSSFSSTRFVTTTTTDGHIEHSTGRHLWLSSMHSSRPNPHSSRRPSTIAFAATRLTPPARSPCATSASCTTIRSEPPIRIARSGSWSPHPTSASSTKMASSFGP